MDLWPPACLLAGIAIALAGDWLWFRAKRRSNVVELPKREPSNVVPLNAYRNNVRVMPQRRWGA